MLIPFRYYRYLNLNISKYELVSPVLPPPFLMLVNVTTNHSIALTMTLVQVNTLDSSLFLQLISNL